MALYGSFQSIKDIMEILSIYQNIIISGAGILEFPYLFSKVGLITAFMFLAFLLLFAGTENS